MRISPLGLIYWVLGAKDLSVERR